MNIHQLIKTLKEMKSLPEIDVPMWGDGHCKKLFNRFIKPHTKYKLVQNKKWGAAILPLPNNFEEYLKGKPKQALRTNRNRAIKSGFFFQRFPPPQRLEEIFLINSSAQVRQGRPMNPGYLDMQRLQKFYQNKPKIYGVFDSNGVLKAYADTPVCGEIAVFHRLLGHGEDLEKGIMYLLISEIIREMIDRKLKNGLPKWVMYDTILGGSPTLRYFKERLGFCPYKVNWVWTPDTSYKGIPV